MAKAVTVKDLREVAEQCVAEEPSRLGTEGWWRKPLLVTAAIDGRFEILPKIAFEKHWQPKDLLATAKSVIVFFIPFNEPLIKENKKSDRPCRNWGVAYVQTNDLIGRVSQALGDFLGRHGFKSGLTPATHNFDEVKLMARWSHKHLGHLAGLGRFGTHRMLITPAGCTGRLGSLVTEATLGDAPLIETQEACLLKAGKQCGKCIEVCPVSALGEKDFDRQGCWKRLKENRATLEGFADLPESTHVCGKCAALMPCSFKNPVGAMS
jgi:epoxyqueuosine reductase QueG